MSRDVPFDKFERCEICGKDGCYDFMGDLICPDCLEKECTIKDTYNGGSVTPEKGRMR